LLENKRALRLKTYLPFV